jgi:signal transduction histidine kinase
MGSSEGILITALILICVIQIILLTWFVARYNDSNKLTNSQKKRIDELLTVHKADQIRIQELESEKQKLFGVISHEVRGPFNRIFALVQLIQLSSGNLQKEQKEYLRKIHIMIADGLGLLRNLTDSQKLEGNEIELNPDRYNLSTLLGVLTRQYKVLAEKKNIFLHIDIVPNLVVFADRYYSNRIFENLLANAVKFSSENQNIFIKAKDDGEWVTVELRDEGPEISEEDQKRLYKKFQTLSAKPTSGETATGIGLSVAKSLADRVGAQLACVSIPGQGTTFIVRIRKEKLSENPSIS